MQQKGDFTANGGFRSPFRSQRGIFAAKGQFRSQGHFHSHFAAKGGFRRPFCSPFRSCEMGLEGCEMALVCQWGISQLRKFSQGLAMGLRNVFAAKGHFRSHSLISQWAPCGCEIISQPRAIFVRAPFGLRNFADHGFFLAFELLLIPRDLPSISLQFLLILIIQKPMLNKNKVKLKH